MSRATLVAMVAVLALAAAGAGLFLWERTRSGGGGSGPSQAERLLIGFNPQTVHRVRLRQGDHTAELVRRHGVWESVSGGPVRVDVLLQRIATLRVRPTRRRAGRTKKLGKALADILVWRGRARPLLVRLYQPARRLLLTTSDRPGVYTADARLLALLRRELQQPVLPTVWPLDPRRLASVELAGETTVTLVHRSGRWFTEDGAAYAPADPTAVGQLLRALAELRVTHRVAQGVAAVQEHGLGKPRLTIKVDDGTRRTLRLGGVCPRDKGARLATLGGKTPTVVCVTRLDPRTLAGPFVSTRLFSAAADEIKAVNVTRGGRTLALVNRPGSGGWKMISPAEGQVDQQAAAGFVADLARLRGRPPAASAPRPPVGAKQVGSVLLTPLVGSEERVAIHAVSRDAALWARPEGGGRWLQIHATDRRLLAADPVLLRSRTLCTARADLMRLVAKTQPGRVTELIASSLGSWQLVLLSGRLDLTRAARIGANLQDYRRAGRQGATAPHDLGWKRPVLLVGSPDRAHLATLLHHLTTVRAEAFVTSRARPDHGLGRRALRLSYEHLTDCGQDPAGKRRCKRSRCELELGSARPGGDCYARRVGDPAVFVASAGLCQAARSPLASRRVVDAAMHRLASITLRQGRKTRRLIRIPGRGWTRPAELDALTWESATGVLLELAPMTALAVDGYGRAGLGPLRLTAVLKVQDLPAIRLDFHDTADGASHPQTVRKGLPVRYRVSARMLRDLQRLLGKK